MLTEVDTRDAGGQSVSLYMDTDAQVYLVCVEGYEPITCLTRDRALMAYKHPWVYMPLEGAVSPSNATEGGSQGQEMDLGLTEYTASLLIELKDTLSEMSDSDFNWTVGLIADITERLARQRRQEVTRPYDHGEEDVPF